MRAELLKSEVSDAFLDEKRIRPGTNFYFAKSPDRTSLIFSYPVFVKCRLLEDFPEAKEGYDGAVAGLIESIKDKCREISALHPLGGLDTGCPGNYSPNIEPVTFCRVSSGTGQMLWKAGPDNYMNDDGIFLTLCGAVPYPGDPVCGNVRRAGEIFSSLLESVAELSFRFSRKSAEAGAMCSLDQKLLRKNLSLAGLVSFIADNTLPARTYTRHRGYFRIAGPGKSSNVPFVCPLELEPVEMELMASGGSVTGLGIRKKEVFAVTGSNAEGKSTFLQTVRSGCDDHLPGDGREQVVTSGSVMTAESCESDISGSDISMFFSALPPGASGSPKCVFGSGSGSMGMAAQFSEAVRKKAQVIVVDEDKSATNLLVPNCMQGMNVTPLSLICRKHREKLGGSSVVFAAATMDILVSEADRIMEFRDHTAFGIKRDDFRKKLRQYLESVIKGLQ
ncbi:putative ABC-class ATPase [Methanomicrobium sp. W14]|uniref:P-loop domain-containing protein n=1 Tax=Methanomicrobium sp. W14 TaxID=2817839 RepID=UPI001AE59ADF|nr:P-loop domain-containing protein [Methanomicrobium sp. W14]MBP2133465.1 putative ABC-class ATPase [Methanomicrobium sp. W14]